MQAVFHYLDNEKNVLALLQQGYAFIERADDHSDSPLFVVGIPHTDAPVDREVQLLSGFLKSLPAERYAVHHRFFPSEEGRAAIGHPVLGLQSGI